MNLENLSLDIVLKRLNSTRLIIKTHSRSGIRQLAGKQLITQCLDELLVPYVKFAERRWN